MSPTLEEVERSAAIQRELALTVFRALPAGQWTDCSVAFVQAGDDSSMRLGFSTPDGGRDSIPIGRTAMPLWTSLRESMVDGPKGTWLSAVLTVEAAGKYHYDFNYDERPFANAAGDVLTPPADLADALPDDGDWREDLRRFPRAPEFLTGWMVDLIDVDDPDAVPAAESTVIAAAKAAPVSWPEGLEFLRSEPVWVELFDEVAAGTVRELGVDSATVRKLADPEEDRGGWLDGLLQDVFGAVWDGIVGDRLDALWAGLERGGVVTGPADAEKRRDDLSDALGDMIAQQLTDRFGFAPES